MAASRTLQVRLTPAEWAMIDRVRTVDGAELTPSELVRLLLHREHKRRTEGTSRVAAAEYSGEFRTGRPSRPAV